MLELNITLLFQLANFFIAVIGLNYLLVRPIRDVIKRRKGIVSDLTAEIDGFTGQASKRLDDYEASLSSARHEAGVARAAARAQGAEEQRAMVGAAQQEARDMLEKARTGVQAEAEATLAALRKQVGGLAGSLTERLLKA
ncbi:MAG: ATP synthase F0 subunit B [Desulfovibrio sp.]|jgi:F-type H+-transporting ATPase subunit b|nr:ATP synthase F0 subunit B [Desulfovibrio sp.]